MNKEFLWEWKSLSQEDTDSNVPHLISKDKVSESIIQLKNGKAAGPSGFVLEMVKSAGEAWLPLSHG